MKASELMLGDWVSHHGKNIKVFSLEADADTEYGVIGDIEISNVEPIPLTQEILDKNGFEKIIKTGFDKVIHYPGYYWVKCEAEDGAISIYDYGNRRSWTVNMETFSGLFLHCEINFVHELQHCLQLCGIDKEIEL